jgi:ubiquinone/menaquinone biosynthesis C-methylase UbiE
VDVEKLFDEKSEIYASARPRYPNTLYEWLLKECKQHQLVWDVACGNGQAANDLINYFEFVQATDISASQIANAPNCDRISFSVQSAESTTFIDESFDAVCVAQALHWFDYELFWPEVQRVLKPSGVFAAWGYIWPHIDRVVDVLLEKSFLSVIKPYWSDRNRILWDGYREIILPFKRIKVPDIKMSVNWSVEQLFAYLYSWSATRLCMQSLGNSFFENSYSKIVQVWGPQSVRSVSMDFVFIAGRKD